MIKLLSAVVIDCRVGGRNNIRNWTLARLDEESGNMESVDISGEFIMLQQLH